MTPPLLALLKVKLLLLMVNEEKSCVIMTPPQLQVYAQLEVNLLLLMVNDELSEVHMTLPSCALLEVAKTNIADDL